MSEYDVVEVGAGLAGFDCEAIHGYRSLEGTFLGNCLFTGKVA